MKTSHSALAITALGIALALPAGAQTTSTISEKLIGIMTYVKLTGTAYAQGGTPVFVVSSAT